MFAIILIVAVILSVFVTFEYLTNTNQTLNQTSPSIPTKTYSANGISFNYSADWEEGNKPDSI